MRYLIDTCVISEAVKPAPAMHVIHWLESIDEHSLYLSVLTLGELQKGISALAPGKRRQQLQAWLDQSLMQRFSNRIFSVDGETALEWGVLSGQARASGVAAPAIDTLLAATARQHNLTLVTRNIHDFAPFELHVFNPWESTD
nr:type II toxin-antitoxin system VapC family toxin [uncultured Halomonas sp.]